VPDLVVADPRGRVFEVPELAVAGRAGRLTRVPSAADFIPMPPGSDLFALPDRVPLGYDRATGELVRLETYRGMPVRPVAVFMAPAHTATWWTAFRRRPGAPVLPMFAYTAAGWDGRRLVAAGIRVDEDPRQDPDRFPPEETLRRRASELLARWKGNRLVEHVVERCALCYRCPAARNFVLGRWEAPLPTAPGCNAACAGCISRPPREYGIPPTQPRLEFVPSPEEIAEMAVAHLETAERPVVSFGQGCEGEPLLQADILEEAIRLIRKRTSRGVVNLNTNASDPEAVERLARAGLDSIRVSLNSAQPELYARYYRPRGYAFEDVVRSMEIMRRYGRWISLNYFVFPGVTDLPTECSALVALCRRVAPDLIQMRNLNMDPDAYLDVLGPLPEEPPLGVRAWMDRLRSELAGIRFGYFNPPKEVMARSAGGEHTGGARSGRG
jgi:pyruvate-formate lyase-activating enzyme